MSCHFVVMALTISALVSGVLGAAGGAALPVVGQKMVQPLLEKSGLSKIATVFDRKVTNKQTPQAVAPAPATVTTTTKFLKKEKTLF